ncbi:MAG TPA: PRC-barrel domain-containing protein [Chloroflexota bacterium]|nr:PRC-barrel domain-containing protein [Chloroflexota bacterium]
MEIQVGADVRRGDGERLGSIRGLVYDPATEEVTSLLVERAGLLGGEAIVPIGVVESADVEAVILDISRDQFDEMRRVVDRNVAPPPTRDDDEPDPDDGLPDAPPVGAATGVESIAFTPIIEESVPMPSSDEIIGPDTTVWASDGEIGQVRAVWVDEQTRRIQALLIERGVIFHTDQEIRMEWVASVKPETIVLNVPKSEVEAANRDGTV